MCSELFPGITVGFLLQKGAGDGKRDILVQCIDLNALSANVICCGHR